MRIQPPIHSPVPGQPLTLKCSATHFNETLGAATSHAVLQWYKDGIPLNQGQYTIRSDVSEEEICLSLEFATLTHHDNGEYTCRGHLLSPLMRELLVVEDTIVITAPGK